MLRHLIELASRNVISPARLPARYGRRRIYLSPANRLSAWRLGDRKFDPYLLALADRFAKPGAVVWDIGANAGEFSIAAAARGAKVVAFEPDAFNSDRVIQRTLEANPDLDIAIVRSAVAAHVGNVGIVIPKRGRCASTIDGIEHSSQLGGVREQLTVRCTTADAALAQFGAPDFVKCDVEGAETLVLQGASRLLSEVRPTFALEIRNATEDAVAEILTSHGYKFATPDGEALASLTNVTDFIATPIGNYPRPFPLP